jgi:hypothetical protein
MIYARTRVASVEDQFDAVDEARDAPGRSHSSSFDQRRRPDPLASRDYGGMPNHGHQITMAARLRPENALYA